MSVQDMLADIRRAKYRIDRLNRVGTKVLYLLVLATLLLLGIVIASSAFQA